MIKYTTKNCEKLADMIVDKLEVSSIMQMLTETFSDDYQEDEDLFNFTIKQYDLTEEDFNA